jgi:glutaredoxin
MQAEQRTMPGSKVHDVQPGGFAVRAISTLQAEDRMDSFSSSTGAAARQLPVALITTTGCQFCNQAKTALDDAEIAYEEIDLGQYPKLLTEVKQTTGRVTVPQVFLGGLLIGGAEELQAALSDGSFKDALDGSNEPALPADLREAVDRTLAQHPAAAVPRPLLPDGMSEERYSHLQGIARRIGEGLLPNGNRMFTLAEGGEWLRRARVTPSPDAGLGLLSDLQRAHLLFVADGSGADLATVEPGMGAPPSAGTVLQLVENAPHAAWGECLNVQVPWYGDAHPASQVAEGLRTLISGLYDKHLAADGRGVDYASLAHDVGFRDYITASAELTKVDLTYLDRRELTAFFINIYNALVIHGMVLFGPADSTLKRLAWFGAVRYNIGGMEFSCNDIEHGVLRGNAPSPASLGVLLGRPRWASNTFKKKDPRARLAVQPMDKRIHFALVCGAKSCPPIRVYTPDELDEGLDAAAAAFCEGEVNVDHEGRSVALSMIFKWYADDFGPRDVLLPWLLRFLPDGPAHELEDLLAHLGPDNVKISYKPYDWSLNNSGEAPEET